MSTSKNTRIRLIKSAPFAPRAAGAEKAYERFLPEALRLDALEIIPFRASPQMVHYNVLQGVRAVMDEGADLTLLLSDGDVKKLESLPDLSLAAFFAASRVKRRPSAGPLLRRLQARERHLREILFLAAKSLAAAGILPQSAVDRTRGRRGPIAHAHATLALASVFTRSASEVQNRTPVTAAQVVEAADVATQLLSLLKPRGAKTRPTMSRTLEEAVDARDRLFTLLTMRHEMLWRVAAQIFGRAAANVAVPLLGSRACKRLKKRAPSASSSPVAPIGSAGPVAALLPAAEAVA